MVLLSVPNLTWPTKELPQEGFTDTSRLSAYDIDKPEVRHAELISSTRSLDTETYPATADTTICNYDAGGLPDINSNMGGEEYLFLPKENSIDWKIFRILIKFDISSIPPNSDIFSANIELFYYESLELVGTPVEGGISSPLTITAYALTRDWVEGTGLYNSPTQNGATWNSYDGISSWSVAGGDYTATLRGSGATPSSYGTTSIDITDIVKAWVDGTAQNFGVILQGSFPSGTDDYLKYFRSTEYSTSSQRPRLEIERISNKAPKVQNPIDVFYIDEDTSLKYNLLYHPTSTPDGIFYDEDFGDNLNFFLWTGTIWAGVYESNYLNANIIVDEGKDKLEIITKPNIYGSDDIKLLARDVVGESVTHNLTIEIAPINDPPVLNKPNKWDKNDENSDSAYTTFSKDGMNIEATQDKYVDLFVTASDVDSTSLKFDIVDYDISNLAVGRSSFEDEFTIVRETGNLKFYPNNDWVGTFEVTFSASDLYLRDEKTYNFKISNVNDDPVLLEVNGVPIYKNKVLIDSSFRVTQDKLFLFNIKASDPDIDIGQEDELRFKCVSKHVEVNFDGAYSKTWHRFSMKPDKFDAARRFVLVNTSISDNFGHEMDDWAVINFSIINVNDPPMIEKIDDLPAMDDIKDMGSISYRESINVTIEAYDIDEDQLYCIANGSTTVSILDDNKWNINFSPEYSDIGKTYINITITDSDTRGLQDWLILTWTVEKGDPLNTAPVVILQTQNPVVKQGKFLTIEGFCKDDSRPIGRSLVVYVRILAGYVQLLPKTEVGVHNGVFVYDYKIPEMIAGESTEGFWTIEAWASDGDLEGRPDTTTLSVEKNDQNNLPAITTESVLYGGVVIGIITILIFLLIMTILKNKARKKSTRPSQPPPPSSPGNIKCPICQAVIAQNSTVCPVCNSQLHRPSRHHSYYPYTQRPPMYVPTVSTTPYTSYPQYSTTQYTSPPPPPGPQQPPVMTSQPSSQPTLSFLQNSRYPALPPGKNKKKPPTY